MKHPNRLSALPWHGLAVAVLLGLAFVARFVPPELQRDLHPWPDSVEYTLGAKNLAEQGRFTVSINGVDLPSRYSPGFSLLLAPLFLLPGREYADAVLVVLALGILSLVLVYRLGRWVFGPTAGVFAVWWLVLSPLDALVSSVIMSEAAASICLLVAVGAALVPWGEADAPFWRGLGAAAAAGGALAAACWIRSGMVVLLPVFLGSFLMARALTTGRRRQAPVLVLACAGTFLLGYVPLLMWNAEVFGSPWRTGYHLWLPGLFSSADGAFAWSHAFGEGPGAKGYLQALGGIAQAGGVSSPLRRWDEPLRLYSPVLPALAGVALAVVLWRRGRTPATEGADDARIQRGFAGLAVAIVIVNASFHAGYFFYDLRFLHSSVPLLAVLAGAGTALAVRFARRAIERRGWRRLLAMPLVLVALMMGWQTAHAVTRGVLWRTYVRARPLHCCLTYEQLRLIREVTEEDAFVVGAWPPVLFAAYQRDSRRTFVPLRAGEVVPAGFPLWSVAEDPGRLAELVDSGKPVYYAGDPDGLGDAPPGLSLREEATRTIPGTRYAFALYRLVRSSRPPESGARAAR